MGDREKGGVKRRERTLGSLSSHSPFMQGRSGNCTRVETFLIEMSIGSKTVITVRRGGSL